MSFENYISKWKDILTELKLISETAAYGWFGPEGNILAANKAMNVYMGVENDGHQPVYEFINPDFNKISRMSREDGPVFEGLLTIGNYSDISFVLKAKIFKRDEVYLVFAQADALHLFQENKKMSHLNQEVNNLQRQLLKEKKLLENALKELEQANTKLKDLNIEKNKYIGVVTHDLRNPIGNAYNFTELLLSENRVFSDDQRLEFIKTINERCSYALNLIEDFLDTSKIESGILDLNFKNWDYCQLIKESIAQNTFFAQKKSQEIIYECTTEKLFVLCDKNKMEQVINNLISNAIKFSPDHKKIWIKIEEQDKQLVTRVIDEGQGVPESELKTLFDSYTTTSVKSTAGEKSTGLGLAIVKKIVEAHHGLIEVKSKMNEGTEFAFTLPTNSYRQ